MSAAAERTSRGRRGAGLIAAPEPLRDRAGRSWLKRLLPQSMFGRSLLLIVIPLVLVQIIAAFVFYARHWEAVSYRLSADVAGDIALVIDAMHKTPTAGRAAGRVRRRRRGPPN